MSIKDSMDELKEYFGEKKKETTKRAKILKKQRDQEKVKSEYASFKKVVFKQLDELFYSDEYSRVVVQPVKGKESLYRKLLEDEEFNRFYEGKLTAGKELDVKIKSVENL